MTRLVHDRGFLQVNQVIPNLHFIKELVVPPVHLRTSNANLYTVLAPQGDNEQGRFPLIPNYLALTR